MGNAVSLESMRSGQLPTVVFGIGAAGEALYHSCRQAGIRVDAFTDNNGNKAKHLFGLEVIHAEQLSQRYSDANFVISAAAIEDVVSQLERLGFHRWFPGSSLLEDFDLEGRVYSRTLDLVRHAVETVLFCHANYLQPGRVYMRSVDLIVTEKCSMKCVDCANLMQFYANPRNFDLDKVMSWVHAFCRNVDEIGEIRVIGGEPFMNKDCDRIIEFLACEPKIKKVVIYSNATIPLKQHQLDRMRHKKVLFMITDYDELSRRHAEVTHALASNGIKFVSQAASGWTDCAKIGRHHRTDEEQAEVFQNCCANKLYTIVEGRFYRCPFVANAIQLRAVPDFPTDHVDVMKGDVREQLRGYVFDTQFLQACDWCNGRRLADPEITPALQTRKPLAYVQIAM